MAINNAHWQFRSDKTIRYIGGAHGTATASYASVLELHRLAQDLGDNDTTTNDDFLDITVVNPTDKKFDTIVQLKNGWTLDEAHTTPASEYLYGGSIIQGEGGTEVIWDGIKVVANRGILVDVIQNDLTLTNRYWNNVPDSEKTAATATVTGVNGTGQKVLNVSDSSEFPAGTKIMIGAVTDEEYLVDSVTNGTTIVLTENLGTATTGGETIYLSTRGINPDAANGVAMQFMVKVRDAGADIDNRTLIFKTAEWFSTYSGFRIPSTGRGENTVPLTYATDLNNTTAMATVAGWGVDINNTSAGYNQIDLQQGDGVKGYYCAWDRNQPTSHTINEFYERMKYISRSGETDTTETYGIPGQEFRGVTHAVSIQAAASPGAYVEGGATDLSWGTGATAGTGKILAYDATGTMVYIQLLTGVAPGDGLVLTQGANSATSAASNATTEQAISYPFCGQSTGSSLVGAFGFTLEYADLSKDDKLISLDDGITRSPPNNVTFTVTGIESGYRVLIAAEDPGAPGNIDFDQMQLSSPLTGVTTTVTVNSVPANTPGTGTLRIHRVDGSYTRHPYSDVTGNVFTITSHDFGAGGNNSNASNNVFIGYFDDTSVGTSVNFNTVQTTNLDLFVEARFGGTGPDYTDSIKPVVGKGTLGSTGGSANLSPISDA